MNNNSSKDHIDEVLNKLRSTFERIAERADKLSTGEKLSVTELASEFGVEFGMSSNNAFYPVLKLLIDNYPGMVVKRGKFGGWIKE